MLESVVIAVIVLMAGMGVRDRLRAVRARRTSLTKHLQSLAKRHDSADHLKAKFLVGSFTALIPEFGV